MRPGDLENRVVYLEGQIAYLLRTIQQISQHGKPVAKPAGKFKARLKANLEQTSAADNLSSALAEFIYYDGTQVIYSGVEFTCYDYLLTGGNSMPEGTHVWVEFDPMDSKWWVVQGGCGASDWEPVDPDA